MTQYRVVPSARSYPRLREIFGSPLRDASPEQIESLFDNSDISAQEAEEFFAQLGQAFSSVARDVGHALPGIAQTALPIVQGALPILGTAIGGPAGTVLGGLAGQALGGLAGQIPRSQAPSSQGSPAPRPNMPAPSGAAAQLMQLLGDPRVLQSLGSIALGQVGSRTVSAGGTRVSPSAITNLLGVLANQASVEAMALENYSMQASEYTESMGDPAVAENRAAALLDLLQETYPYAPRWESETVDSPSSSVEASTWDTPEAYEAYYETFFDTSESTDYDSQYESEWETSGYELTY